MKDLIIIGGGPGGYVAAIRASQLGMSVLLVERDSLGGTCLNRGCIPTKSYVQNAAVLRTLGRLAEYNVQADSISFDLPGARARKDRIVGGLVSGIKELLKANHVDLISGQASLTSPGKVLVNGQEITAKRILIATGSAPSLLTIPGSTLPGVVTSDDILNLSEIPARLAVIGGGVIGLEFAGVFNAFGSQVTVCEFLPHILGNLDQEIVTRMGAFLKKQQITVHTRTAVQRIEERSGSLMVVAEGSSGTVTCEADLVLIATGRRPMTAGLGIEALGVDTQKGFIKVDADYQTNVQGIYAIGDVVGRKMLAHVASAEGTVAVERMCGLTGQVDYDAIPACIFTFPEIATVGLSQEEARARGSECRVGKFPFVANGKALTMGETDGLVKVIAGADGTVLGMHIIGPHASDLIPEATLIVKNRITLLDVISTVHPHPTLGEALHEAVQDAAGAAIHLKPRR